MLFFFSELYDVGNVKGTNIFAFWKQKKTTKWMLEIGNEVGNTKQSRQRFNQFSVHLNSLVKQLCTA